MTTALKPFVINIGDIQFLIDQVNLQPLFDASGALIFNWDGATTVYASPAAALANSPLYVPGTLFPGDPAADAAAAINLYGSSYYSVADAGGVRDVSGVANNLDPAHASWGAVDVPFINFTSTGDLGYGHYLNGVASLDPGAFYGALIGSSGVALGDKTAGSYTMNDVNGNGVYDAGDSVGVVDYTPRMITQTIMTGGVKFLTDANGHIVHWNAAQFASDPVYAALFAGIATANLVEGAAVVDTAPTALGSWNAGLYSYGLLMQALGIDQTNEFAEITLNYGTGTFVQVIVFSQAAYDLVNLIQTHGIDTTGLQNGDSILDPNASNPYGLLAEFGVQDQQNPNNGEYFIESQNPGVAPTNGFFAVFGQFFDHGLDFIGKGGNEVKITIPLAQNDPLYGVIGQDGKPTTTITISRASVDHFDENGMAQYVNHTSPFIDQSQTYGSDAQITQILREWVEDPNNAGTHIAGARLLDGDKNVAWTDGFGNVTQATLPTLNELRAHIEATGRDGLTWDDVLDLRVRDSNGQLVDFDAAAAGIQSQGSGHSLLIDMNPHVDGAHLSTPAALAAIQTLSDNLVGSGYAFGVTAQGVVYLDVPAGAMGPGSPATQLTGISALFPWLDFATFSIGNPMFGPLDPASDVYKAVSEIMMDAVGDHYVAGDGRVNENVALTSIHHVFHMEHDYQVQNLSIALFQQDAVNSPADHGVLHEWQVQVTANGSGSGLIANVAGHWEATEGILARDGNNNFYVVADGTLAGQLPVGHSLVVGRDGAYISAAGSYTDAAGFVSWDQDKLFEGTKLVVEMEYQHTAVDQYARAVSPDIPEFSAYSTDIDATISMAYSQGAFRFGHSTLRETIDTMDPNGNMTGQIMSFALQKAFLNPALYAQTGAASLVMGMTKQVMNDIDEFITPAMQQGLLDLPMDLAAINIARGRDVGLPTLNQARGILGLGEYTSWNDFAQNIYHKESLVNFIAAYSFDGDVAHAKAVLDAADGITNAAFLESASITAATAFLNGANTDFNKIDLWIGGLAEAHISGGLLGETFNVVFVDQIQRLMDGDRFYYLYRLAGTQFGDEIINEQFKDMVERTTGATHLNGNIFGYADNYYELSDNASSVGQQGVEHKYGQTLADHPALGIYTNGGNSTAGNGGIISINGKDYVVDLRPDMQPDTLNTDGTPTSGADSNEVLAGTDNDDLIYLGYGDDTGYGDGGNDIIHGGSGGDRIYGGAGNDWLDGDDLPDVVDGGEGDDTIFGGDSGSSVAGFDQLIGGAGNDLIHGGIGIDKIFGNGGDDAIYGDGDTDPFMFGGDGNDIVDGGDEQDNLYGNTGDDLIIGGADKDILFGQEGDDILRPGIPLGSANPGGGNTGNTAFGPDEVVGGAGNTNAVDTGFDLVDLSDNVQPYQVEINLAQQQNPNIGIDQNQILPTMFEIDGVIGTQSGDVIMGAAGGNWLIGGSGSDKFDASEFVRPNGTVGTATPDRTGNDVFVGGSIRLDALIGKYQISDGNGGFVDAAYDHYDGLIGASHRVDATAVLRGGLLEGAGTTDATFDKHFTEMLKSDQFKNLMLGDAGNDASSADVVEFTGVLADYTLEALDINGQPVTDPHTNWGSVAAIRIKDNGHTDPDPLLARAPTDGTDLLIGIEQLKFADGILNPQAYFDIAPTVDLDYVPLPGPNGTVLDGSAGNNNATTYTENAAGTAITTMPAIADPDDSTIHSARITLRETIPGDRLNVGTMPAGVTATGDGTGAIVLSGIASLAAYQQALAAITFDSTSDNPTAQQRHIDVTVNDGLKDSATATTTVTVTPVDDATTAAADDLIITNFGTVAFTVPDWALTANDTDPDGAGINGINTISNLMTGINGTSHSNISQSVTIRDNAGPGTTPGGSFHYSLSNPAIGMTNPSPTVTVIRDASGPLDGTVNADIIVGNGGSSTINADGGNDIIFSGRGADAVNAGDGDDTIVWNANNANGNNNNGTDGRDVVDGGANATAMSVGDTFIVNGSNANETFNVYTVADWLALGGNLASQLNAGTEIVVARGGLSNNKIIAELRNVEELVINTGGGNDTVNVSGNFDATHLAYNTIHINGDDGDDTVDISGLTSDHRIVFHGNGGSDNVMGDLRPQDVVDSVGGSIGSSGNGTTNGGVGGSDDDDEDDEADNRAPVNSGPLTLQPLGVNTQMSLTAAMLLTNSSDPDGDMLTVANLTASSGTVSQGNDGSWTFTPESDDTSDVSFSYEVSDGSHSIAQSATLDLVAASQSGDAGAVGSGAPAPASDASIGTDGADVMIGGGGEDVLSGDAGDDLIIGNSGNDTLIGGAGDDLIKGGDGNDVVFGGSGNDDLFGGSGNDMVFGDSGNDRIFADDGNDVVEGGSGNDTVYGGAGDDRILATLNDGDDVYWGDAGQDTLDYAAITANLTVDLGNGTMQHGSVTSALSGNDAVFGFENIIAGSGNDTISASGVANIMDGGLGNDTFIFGSAQDANGDTINGFQPGDKIDLSGIDADDGTVGHQSFVLFAGTGFTAAGQILVLHEIRDGVDHTIVAGNTQGGASADFEIDLVGYHNLSASDFSGVS